MRVDDARPRQLVLQRQVLAFYRVVLRAARDRDAAQRAPIQAYARAEFDRYGARRSGTHMLGVAGSSIARSALLLDGVFCCAGHLRRTVQQLRQFVVCTCVRCSSQRNGLFRDSHRHCSDDASPLCRHRDLDRRDFQRIEHLLRKVPCFICVNLSL